MNHVAAKLGCGLGIGAQKVDFAHERAFAQGADCGRCLIGIGEGHKAVDSCFHTVYGNNRLLVYII